MNALMAAGDARELGHALMAAADEVDALSDPDGRIGA